MATQLVALAEFTEGDTSAIFDYSAKDPSVTGSPLIDWSTFSSVKLRAKGNKTGAVLGTPIVGAVQNPNTKVRFDCQSLVALGVDVYTCQVFTQDAGGVRTGDDFLAVVKEKSS